MNRKFLARLGDRRRGALPWVTFGNDWLTLAGDLSGVVSSDRITVAGRIRVPSHGAQRAILQADDAVADLTCVVRLESDGNLTFSAVNTAFTVGTNGPQTVTAAPVPVGQIVDYVVAFRNATGLQSLRCWINGAEQVISPSLLAAGAIDLPAQAAGWRIGADWTATPAARFAGDMAYLWANFGTTAAAYVTDPAKFAPSALGANGEGPTGAAPAVYFAGNQAVWNGGSNLGTGGAFAMSGAVVDAT